MRADEKRLGYKSTNENLLVKFPFIEDNSDKEKVHEITEFVGGFNR